MRAPAVRSANHETGASAAQTSLSRSLVFPALLAVIAGFVDAVGFLHLFGVFPANQSGNIAFLGMAFAGASPTPAWPLATAVVGFMAGAASGVWLASRLRPERRASVLLAVELLLLVSLASLAALVSAEHTALVGGWQDPLIVLASMAMGVQTEVIRRTAGVTIATTYQTGGIAHISEATGALMSTTKRAAPMHVIIVLAVVVTGYIAGAALGATRLGEGRTGLVLPCAAVALSLMATIVASRTVIPGLDVGNDAS